MIFHNKFHLGVEARKATGDGNCLYNATSIVLAGDESISPLLRLLILKDLLSQKFVRYLYFMMDVGKVLLTFSKTFQSDELCITDVVTSLETTLTLLEQLRLEKGPQYKKFVESDCEETGILKCGKNNTQEIRLTRVGSFLESQLDSFLTEVKGYFDTRFGNIPEVPLKYKRNATRAFKSGNLW